MYEIELSNADGKSKINFRRLLRFTQYSLFIVAFLFSNCIFADTPTIKKLIDDGIELLLKKKASAAINKFEKVLLLSPDHPEAYFRIGQTYIQNKKLELGLDFIKKSIRQKPRDVRYSLYLSNIYERLGKVKEARDEYQRIIDTGTRDPRIKEVEKLLALASGRSLAQKGELNAALLIFNGLTLEYPDDSQVLYNIGNAYMLLNRTEEAELTFSKLYLKNPKNPTVNMSLATIFDRTRRPKRAMKHLKNIIDMGNKDQLTKAARVQYHIIDGRERLAIKDWEGALKALQIVVNLDPKRTEAFFNISMANLQLGNTLMAERGFLSVLKVNPNDYSARLNLGQMYFDSGKTEEAKEQFQYIIDNDSTGRWAKQAKIRMNVLHTMVADRALEGGNVAESLVEYEKALDYFSANVKASFNRGMIFIRQKKYGEARVEFESVIRHSPKNLRGRINLANVYEQLNMLSQAAEQYEMIMQIDKNSREGQFAAGKWKITKARGLWADKRLAEAEKIFAELVVEQPNNFQAFAFLGILQASKGKLRKAAISYQKVLDLRPTNYAVKILLGKVYEQLGMDSLAANEYRGIIFAGGTIPQVPEAEARLAAVESRLSGFSNSLNYQFVYDNNLNLNDQNPTEEIRSDLALSFIYALKARDDLSFRASWSPTYSTYHLGQTDYLRSVLQSSLILGSPDKNWSVAVNRQDQSSLVNDSKLSEATSLSFGRGLKVFAKPLLNLSPIGSEGEKIATSLNVNSSLRYITTSSNTPIESLTGSIALSLNQALRWGVSANLSYVLTIYRNINKVVQTTQTSVPVSDPVTGLESNKVTEVIVYDPRDYEFNSHTGSLNLRRVLAPGLMGSLSLVGVLSGYANLDSGAVARGEDAKRINLTTSVSPSLSYSFFKDLRFVISASLQKNFSSLPVGLSTRQLDNDDVIAAFQSTSLGKYNRYSIEGGFVMTF